MVGSSRPLPSSTGTAIIIEPDVWHVSVVSELLARYGFSVVTARDPQEALALCQQSPADLLVIDLPLSSQALEALLPMTRLSPFMRIIAVSAYATGALRLGALGHRPIPVLRKPLDEQHLRAALDLPADRQIRLRADRPAMPPRLYLIK